jgi:hypothetical protein
VSKPTAVRIPSDDCTVTVAGKEYHVHEGEWIEIMPGGRVGEFEVLDTFFGIEAAMAAVKGDPDESRQGFHILNDALKIAVPVLRDRILAWTWTDDAGRPLPQPCEGDPAFRLLQFEELSYLVATLARGESRKSEADFTKPSRIIRSATARRRNRT